MLRDTKNDHCYFDHFTTLKTLPRSLCLLERHATQHSFRTPPLSPLPPHSPWTPLSCTISHKIAQNGLRDAQIGHPGPPQIAHPGPPQSTLPDPPGGLGPMVSRRGSAHPNPRGRLPPPHAFGGTRGSQRSADADGKPLCTEMSHTATLLCPACVPPPLTVAEQ